MKIITSGFRYLDIDAYGGIIAYAELLQKQGIVAKAVSTAPLNESVTPAIRSWPVTLNTAYTPKPNDTFVIIDTSEPGFFDIFVAHDRVEHIIDHHPGHEAYWQERIGAKADIEPVGAACTKVYEYWKKAGLTEAMSETSARLLICGILDNTLNFGALITTQRDHDAYDDLMHLANLPQNWPSIYFGDCQATILQDPINALKGDTKVVQYASRTDTLRVGQSAVWNANDLLKNSQSALEATFSQDGDNWFINIISIEERKSYFICTNPSLQQWLSELLHVTFKDSIAAADRLWLRKEITKQAIDKV